MDMRRIFLTSMLCTASVLCAQESAQPPLPESSTAAIEQEAPTTNEKPTVTTSAKPKPKPSLLKSFYRFTRIFLKLLSNETIKNNVQMVEQLLVNLMQTAYQVIQTTKIHVEMPTRSDVASSDKALIKELADGLLQEVKSHHLNRAPIHNNKMDEPTKEILANFAAIVQNFFTILQDPENPQVVPASIIGMLAGMVNIGTIAMTKGGLPLDADEEQLKAYAEALDVNMKQDMYRMILSKREHRGISFS